MVKFLILMSLMLGFMDLSLLSLDAAKTEERILLIDDLARMHPFHLSSLA